MTITLFHHPYSRAATVVWMLEELGLPYELEFVDILAGEQHHEAHLARNPMGKVPVLHDGELMISETSAIGIYLADRYSLGKLAPAIDDALRGKYLQWSIFGATVVEPGCMARAASWDFKPGNAGWGKYETMVSTLERTLSNGPWILGDRFTMADVTLGATIRWMLQFKMLDALPAIQGYADRLGERPANKAAAARNREIAVTRGLEK